MNTRKLSTNDELFELISQAHINILPTFQNTGIKLKLINALFTGRFCLANNDMVQNTGLEKLCSVANSKKEFIDKIELLIQEKFTNQHISERELLLKTFDTEVNAKNIINLLS